MPNLQTRIPGRSSALVLVLACCMVAAGQSPAPAGAHGIVVRKHSWHSHRPGWDRRRPAAMGPMRDSTGQINPPVLLRADPVPRLGYIYQAQVGNTGPRVVRAIVWEFRVIEKGTGQATAHRFRNELKLKPGAKAELRGFSYQPPSVIVSAESAGKKYGEAFDEEVVIISVVYEDGSTWATG